jgi:N-methylhydantoinase A
MAANMRGIQLSPAYRVGVDIGGTFTDIVFLSDDGKLHTKKVSSSVEDYSRAITEGIAEAFAETSIGSEDLSEIRHGTTVGSNAILERKGARVGVIGTKGFRDILDIRTLRMPRLYDLRWEKPRALAERRLRVTVDERIDAAGAVQKGLEEADAEAAVRKLLAEGVEAIAICLLNSFNNPVHEEMLKRTIQRLAPDLVVCTSFEVLPEIKEYERTSTTVINAFLKPVVSQYLRRLRTQLDRAQINVPLLLMQSNGGLTTDRAAAELPIHIVESGPAGGVVGAQALAESMGLPNVITFDMGGTTAKASLIENNQVTRVHECEVGGGVIVGSRLLTGAGYTLKVPAIDLAEVGAGGGSIISIDAGGSMRVGPQSAGAFPGPVCYDLGGEQPTITDANVVLGLINPDYLVGGVLRLNAQKSRTAIAEKVATPLGLSTEHAAYGAHQIAAANMIRAIKSVSTERGRDPRHYTMFAFGGNGPLFAAGMAEAMGIRRIVVPPVPGLFSSFGLLCAEVEHHYSRTFRSLLRKVDVTKLNSAWDRMARQAEAQLQEDGFTGPAARIERRASLHYQGQTFELTVPVAAGPIEASKLQEIEEAFGREHESTYGHRAGPDEPVELITIITIGRGLSDRQRVPDLFNLSRPEPPAAPARLAYFGPKIGSVQTPVLRRGDLIQTPRAGPLIIEEYDATCLVPPNAQASLDARGNIVVEL